VCGKDVERLVNVYVDENALKPPEKWCLGCLRNNKFTDDVDEEKIIYGSEEVEKVDEEEGYGF